MSFAVLLGWLAVTFPGPTPAAPGTEESWIDLTSLDPALWKTPHGQWFTAADARMDQDNPRRLASEPGSGVLVNGPTGRTSNLVTWRSFGDVELSCEFLIPRGSNSGIKLAGLYEIQIHDSHGIEPPRAQHCGGVYPRASLLPKYHYLDDGHPPRVNAAKPAGEWQSLEITFHAPRFDADGKKIANARFDRVVLNGQVIHENLELKTPTGHAWTRPEVPAGPILLQADHGPVAFRNLRVRALDQ